MFLSQFLHFEQFRLESQHLFLCQQIDQEQGAIFIQNSTLKIILLLSTLFIFFSRGLGAAKYVDEKMGICVDVLTH